MEKPRTFHRIILICGLILMLSNCKKSNPNKQNVAANDNFHLDQTNSTGQINRTIYFGESLTDPQLLVSVSSTAAGPGSFGQSGFNMMTLDKGAGIKMMYNYITDSLANYTSQIANCADQDSKGNIWIGGVAHTTNYGKPYVLELDKTGNIILAKCFLKKQDPYTYKGYNIDNIKVLRNGDILLLLVGAYDVQLIRMKIDGTVIWNKQYAITNASVFILAQGHNSFIAENAQGDIFFMSNQYYFANGGTYLTRITSSGNLVYSVGYRGITFSLYLQLKFLSTGELLMFGQNDLSYVPFIVKIKPEDGSIINSYSISNNIGNNTPVNVDDITEVNGQFKMIITTGSEYDIFTLSNNFDITASIKTLARSGGAMSPAAIVFDSQTNSLFHLVDTPGPNAGSFLQFLRTGLDGLSCHGVFSTAPLNIKLSAFDPLVSRTAVMAVTDDIPGDQPIKFIKNPISTNAIDSCGQ